MKFQLVALNHYRYEQMITNNPSKCIDIPYSEMLNSFVLKAFADHNSNAAQIIGLGIHKLKYCGRRRRKYWFPAILYNSILTLKAFLGLLTILKYWIFNVFKHNLVFLCLEKEQSFLV